jgi:hypothetical protein
MNHLTDEQLAAWLAGESGSQQLHSESPAQQIQSPAQHGESLSQHIESCAQCRAEAYELRDRISRYAIALRRQAADSQSSHLAQFLSPRQALLQHRLRWAGAAVLALLLVVQTAWLVKPRPAASPARPIAGAPAKPQPKSPSDAATSGDSMSDDELLEAVNNDLSREVPQALAPVSAITVARNRIAAAAVDATQDATTVSPSRKQGEQK